MALGLPPYLGQWGIDILGCNHSATQHSRAGFVESAVARPVYICWQRTGYVCGKREMADREQRGCLDASTV